MLLRGRRTRFRYPPSISEPFKTRMIPPTATTRFWSAMMGTMIRRRVALEDRIGIHNAYFNIFELQSTQCEPKRACPLVEHVAGFGPNRHIGCLHFRYDLADLGFLGAASLNFRK